MEINGVAFKDQNSNGTAAPSSLSETFDTFLALLTTQLQNQDPLDPLKSEEFTQQLVQFSSVEQAINQNKKLEQIIQLQTAGQLNSAVSYIGKDVEVVSNKLLLKDGASKITYGLEGNAVKTVISIINEHGQLVRTVAGNVTSGRHEYVWDGKDNNGNQVPDDVYNFTVVSVGPEDKTVDTVSAVLRTWPPPSPCAPSMVTMPAKSNLGLPRADVDTGQSPLPDAPLSSQSSLVSVLIALVDR